MLSYKGICHARVGLMGNPSDGFQGKTLSFLLKNFQAEVILRPLEQTTQVVIHPHPVLDPNSFQSLSDLSEKSSRSGFYGGVRLIQASCKVFYELMKNGGLDSVIEKSNGFEIFYNTNIPRMVGLSGSSAIVLATLRALLSYYGLDIEELGILKHEFPSIVLNIEREELGISAGLQDRVIQVYGGLVHMDFTPSALATGENIPGVFTPVDEHVTLPKMYLAYDLTAGGDSGKVHSTVKQRWTEREPSLVQGMTELGELADKAVHFLFSKQYDELAKLMAKNFALRRKLYGDDVVGERNIQAVTIASDKGLTAKFTGSGGALVCLRTDGVNEWLEIQDEISFKNAMAAFNFRVLRIET